MMRSLCSTGTTAVGTYSWSDTNLFFQFFSTVFKFCSSFSVVFFFFLVQALFFVSFLLALFNVENVFSCQYDYHIQILFFIFSAVFFCSGVVLCFLFVGFV